MTRSFARLGLLLLDTGSELFRDTKYMTAVHLDPSRLASAVTGSDGIYLSHDRTGVPGLYDLPEFVATDETGTPAGTFTLDQRVILRLYDDQGRYLHLETTVVDGPNDVEILWDPALLMSPGRPRSSVTDVSEALDIPPFPNRFALGQNSPNPFN